MFLVMYLEFAAEMSIYQRFVSRSTFPGYVNDQSMIAGPPGDVEDRPDADRINLNALFVELK
jgi:hypothetical protein